MKTKSAHFASAAVPVLLSAIGMAAAQAPSPKLSPAARAIPSRSLLGDIGKAEVGSAATVHTPHSTGPGLVLASSHEILASLHLVLDDKKQIDPHIAVNISTPPQAPVMDVAASVIAQDPRNDLVLLQLSHAVTTAPDPPPATALPALTPASTVHERSARPSRRTAMSTAAPPVAQSEVALPVNAQGVSEHSFYVTNPPPAPAGQHGSKADGKQNASRRGRRQHVRLVYGEPSGH